MFFEFRIPTCRLRSSKADYPATYVLALVPVPLARNVLLAILFILFIITVYMLKERFWIDVSIRRGAPSPLLSNNWPPCSELR